MKVLIIYNSQGSPAGLHKILDGDRRGKQLDVEIVKYNYIKKRIE
jgi:hypothetical protein